MDQRDKNVDFEELGRQIADRYTYSRVTEACEGDRVEAAEQVRTGVSQVLRSISDRVPQSKLVEALERFTTTYPPGEDLDQKFGYVNFGLEKELNTYLSALMYEEVSTEVMAIIEAQLDSITHFDEEGERTEYWFEALRLVRQLDSEKAIAAVKLASSKTTEAKYFIDCLEDAVEEALKR